MLKLNKLSIVMTDDIHKAIACWEQSNPHTCAGFFKLCIVINRDTNRDIQLADTLMEFGHKFDPDELRLMVENDQCPVFTYAIGGSVLQNLPYSKFSKEQFSVCEPYSSEIYIRDIFSVMDISWDQMVAMIEVFQNT